MAVVADGSRRRSQYGRHKDANKMQDQIGAARLDGGKQSRVDGRVQ